MLQLWKFDQWRYPWRQSSEYIHKFKEQLKNKQFLLHYYSDKFNNVNNIVDCQYFTTNILQLDKKLSINNSEKDSFVIYMCVQGEGVRLKSDKFEEQLNYGESILVPANLKHFNFIPLGISKLLEIYIK